MTVRSRVVATAPVLLALALLGCQGERNPRSWAAAGSPDIGRELIEGYGCGSCHRIPGIRGADALVGPPLDRFGRRSYIAGQLVNTPANLARWVRDPQAVEPGTAMPDVGLSEDEARHVAAYLLNLQ